MGEAVAVVRLIREQLKEVVGRRIASAVAETRIQQLLQLYGEEEEGTRCVLHTLLEEVFNEEDQDGFVVFDREEIASVSTLIYHVIVREHLPKKRMFSFGHCPNYLPPSFGQVVHLFRPSKLNIYIVYGKGPEKGKKNSEGRGN